MKNGFPGRITHWWRTLFSKPVDTEADPNHSLCQSSSPMSTFLQLPFECPSYSQTSLSNHCNIRQLELLLMKFLCLEGLVQRNPAETGPFGGLNQATFAVTAAHTLVHVRPCFLRAARRSPTDIRRCSWDLQIDLGCYSCRRGDRKVCLVPFPTSTNAGTHQVEWYLLQRCHRESLFELLAGDPCYPV